MPGIGLITNPRSRINKRDPGSMRRLAYLVGDRGSAGATRSLEDLYRKAEEWKNAGIDILGVNGGDGTIHHTLTAFIKTYGDRPLPLIALLRGGTMNTVANSLGIKGDPPRLLFELIDRYHNHETFETIDVRILRIGDAFGFIFGTGVIYNYLDVYYGTGNPCPSTAAKVLGKAVLSAMVRGPFARHMTRRFRARVTVDGSVWAREDFMSVAAGAVEQIGLGFRPFYRVRERPDAFPILGIHTDAFGFAADLPLVLRGQPMSRHKTIDAVACQVNIETEQPLEYVIDGDTYISPRALTITQGPVLRIVRLTGQAVSEATMEEESIVDPA